MIFSTALTTAVQSIEIRNVIRIVVTLSQTREPTISNIRKAKEKRVSRWYTYLLQMVPKDTSCSLFFEIDKNTRTTLQSGAVIRPQLVLSRLRYLFSAISYEGKLFVLCVAALATFSPRRNEMVITTLRFRTKPPRRRHYAANVGNRRCWRKMREQE